MEKEARGSKKEGFIHLDEYHPLVTLDFLYNLPRNLITQLRIKHQSNKFLKLIMVR